MEKFGEQMSAMDILQELIKLGKIDPEKIEPEKLEEFIKRTKDMNDMERVIEFMKLIEIESEKIEELSKIFKEGEEMKKKKEEKMKHESEHPEMIEKEKTFSKISDPEHKYKYDVKSMMM